MVALLRHWRDTLTQYSSLIPYAILGIIAGLISALLVLAFNQSIELLAELLLIESDADGFEALPRTLHFALPVVGALVLGLLFARVKPEHREVGLVHVLRRLNTNYGALPGVNLVMQFVGGTIAMATGQSGGREGPGVHLGSAIASLFGQRLKLPNNSLRILVACGAAGSIAVAFNTPLAGVIFAMEVILCEYTVVGFIPIILAAASAQVISHYLRFGDPIFTIPAVGITSVAEVPLFLALGICCGIVIGMFIRLVRLFSRFQNLPVILRFLAGGVLTGLLALLVPEILGLGYDSLNDIMQNNIALTALLLILLCKLIATSFSCGMGMPIGMIGPSLVMGACVGGVFAIISPSLLTEYGPQPLLYVVIGMAAAMGTLLAAPLAAMLAVVELTQTVSIVMPAMLAIIAATLINKELFKQDSAHQMALRRTRHLMPQDPLNQLLHSTHVSSCMDINVKNVPVNLAPDTEKSLRRATPKWCLIERDQQPLYLVRGSDLITWLDENPIAQDTRDDGEEKPSAAASESDNTPRDISNTTVQRLAVTTIPVQASLRQALDALQGKDAQAACVYGRDTSRNKTILGVVSLHTIEDFMLHDLKKANKTSHADT